MIRRIKALIATFLILVALTACQTTQTPTVQVTAPSVPAELRHCLNAPGRPTGNFTQADVARFVARLGGAYADCKAKLGQVDRLLRDFDAAAAKSP